MSAGEEIANQLIGIVRRDATVGNAEYRAALRDLREIVNIIEAKAHEEEEDKFLPHEIEDSAPNFFNVGSLEEVVQMYSTVVTKLENLRRVDRQKLLDFAKILKYKEGQKHIFLFYEREFLPQLSPNTITKFMSQYQGTSLQHDLISLFQTYHRDTSMDMEKVKQAFADSSLSIHFLFLRKLKDHRPGLMMQERSEDIYRVFNQMAQATGGITESSANPAFAFKRAVEAFENYYLLYYSPENYSRDGKFKKIEVKLKNKKLKITHRAGYFAN
jgi:VWFA-related protein